MEKTAAAVVGNSLNKNHLRQSKSPPPPASHPEREKPLRLQLLMEPDCVLPTRDLCAVPPETLVSKS